MPVIIFNPSNKTVTPATGFLSSVPAVGTLTISANPAVLDTRIRWLVNFGYCSSNSSSSYGRIDFGYGMYMRRASLGAPTTLGDPGELGVVSGTTLDHSSVPQPNFRYEDLTPTDGSVQTFTITVQNGYRSTVEDVVDGGASIPYYMGTRTGTDLSITCPTLTAAHGARALISDTAVSPTPYSFGYGGSLTYDSTATQLGLTVGTYNLWIMPYISSITGSWTASSVTFWMPSGFVRYDTLGTYEVGDW